MNDIANERVGPMHNPPHLGELVSESMDGAGWNLTETATRLGCGRGTLSRLLNGKAGVSASMALALEEIGWGTAEHWMRMQVAYGLARARRARMAVGMIGPRAHTDGRGTAPAAVLHPLSANGKPSGARSGRCCLMRLSLKDVRARVAVFAQDWKDAA